MENVREQDLLETKLQIFHFEVITGNNFLYAIYKKYCTLYQQYILQHNFRNLTVAF